MGISDIFYFFSARGIEAKGGIRGDREGVVSVLMKSHKGGGGVSRRGGKGARGPGGCLRGIWGGGGLNIFFVRGRNPTKFWRGW